MRLGIRKSFKILAPGNSLRRRTAYSLALVRLILAPVIFLAVYYLFRMSWIVDRIVNIDAPAATLAQQASIEMLEARRAERNFLLLHDANYLGTNRESIDKTQHVLGQIRNLEPEEETVLQKASEALTLYRRQFSAAAAAVERSGPGTTDRVQAVVRAYEQDLNNLLKRSTRTRREQLVEELRKRVNSFDAQISETAQQGNPEWEQGEDTGDEIPKTVARACGIDLSVGSRAPWLRAVGYCASPRNHHRPRGRRCGWCDYHG